MANTKNTNCKFKKKSKTLFMNDTKAPAARALGKKQMKIITNCILHQEKHFMKKKKSACGTHNDQQTN